MAVAPANRKICSTCGADVTFTKRVRNPVGGYFCVPCAPQLAAEPSPSLAGNGVAADLNDGSYQLQEEITPTGRPIRPASRPANVPGRSAAAHPPTLSTRAGRQVVEPTHRRWLWIGFPIVVLLILGAVAGHLTLGRRQADAAAGEATSPVLTFGTMPLASAPNAPPRPGNSKVAERVGTLVNATAPIATLLRPSPTASFMASAAYGQIRQDADQILSSMHTDLIGETSVYRGMSTRARACRDLLALYVRVRGACGGVDVDDDVRHLISDADLDLIGETSALRAIYKHDEAFLHLLGIWCRVADTPEHSLRSAYDRWQNTAASAGTTEDSAPQAIDGNAEAAMHVLASIVSAAGQSAQADACVERCGTDNAGETSAWRSAERDEAATLDLLLLLVRPTDTAAADQIRATAEVPAAGEDSALRAQEDYLDGNVEALRWLIDHPASLSER